MSVMPTQGVPFLETKITASSEGLSENIIEMINSVVTLTHLGHNLILPYLFSSLSGLESWRVLLVQHSGVSQSFIPNRILRNKKKPCITSILVSYCCCHKLPQTQGFKTTITSLFWRTEVSPRSPWAETMVSAGFCCFLGALVDSPHP